MLCCPSVRSAASAPAAFAEPTVFPSRAYSGLISAREANRSLVRGSRPRWPCSARAPRKPVNNASARLARLRDVAPQPKPLKPRGARTGGREPVEGGQLVRPRDDAQVRTIQLHRFGGARQARPGEVGPPPVRRALGMVVGASELQQARR